MSTYVCPSTINNNSSFNAGTKEIKTEVEDDQIDIVRTDIKQEIEEVEEEETIEGSTLVINTELLSQIKLETDVLHEVRQESSPVNHPNESPNTVKKSKKGECKTQEGSAYSPNRKLDFNDSLCKHLTVQELVRIHFDPVISKVDLSKKPIMLLEKVDKYWPVPSQRKESADINLKIKEENLEEWEISAEEEILKANREWTKNNYRVVENVEEEPKRKRKANQKRRKSPDSTDDVDEPDEMEIDDEDEISSPIDDDDDDEDYSPGSRNSCSPDLEEINENFRNHSIDENSNDQEIDVKLELSEEDIKFEDVKIVEIGGFEIETFGDYSKCPKCEKHIKSTFIIRHIKLHDIPTRTLKCPHSPCKATFTRTNNMYRHLKIVHSDEQPYCCVFKDCSEKYKTSKGLREHVSSSHKRPVRREIEELDSLDMKFKCEFPGCGREYGKRQHLKEHFRKHTGDMRYACEVCGERFFVHGHMKRHLYSHTGIKPHACRWKCGAIFASYGGRMKHERAQHSENPYKLECDICGRPFRFDREMDKHKLTHLAPSERVAYRCSFCGIIFDSISHRERHEQRHKDNDTFQCEWCCKYFKNEKNLRHHIKAHHQEGNNKASNKVKDEKKKKDRKEPPKYKCHMCDIPIMFALTALRRHLARKHSTNFKCDKETCGKTFAKKYQYDAHMKLHSHRHCHMCDKDFKRKQNADIHLMGVHGLTKEDLAALGR